MQLKQSEPLMQVDDLHVTYRQGVKHAVKVLDGVSFGLRKGEITALVGESGSGKSTMARALMGLLPPSARVEGGSLRIGAEFKADLSRSNIAWSAVRGRKLGMLFQDARQALNPMLTIGDHFKESLLYHRIATADQVATIAVSFLNRLNFTDGRSLLNRYPFELSGGMCQRICLALTLCLEPKVLIADEPTSALDTVSQKEVLDVLKRLQAELGLTVLLITHDIAVAHAVSQRVIVLNRGSIEEEGDTRAVFLAPRAAYTKQLLASRSPITKATRARRSTTSGGEPVLEAFELCKTFPSGRVLNDVQFTLGQGEILGILGESGSGKSTLARCITGLELPDRGILKYRGTNIAGLKGRARRELARHIQLVFQDARASLHPGRTALQLVQEPLDYMRIGQRKEREMMAAYYLHEVGISVEAQRRRPPELSTGQCQRVAIARALVSGPDVLICDEAVSALDMSVQAQILRLLQRLHKQFDFSILMISHDIRVLRSFCHQIAVMEQGSISEIRAGELLHESERTYTQQLLRCAGELEEGL
ncbi:ABC transporter ATP-binding protein [Paenibacillus sp. YYML68]|uniref:ABC transporter ATP-binding protein n=1 Tax=Paenibacillus sp. YYML68 TaxID=2909250 RepID=UPI002492E472|nr:ABC transporter ATP-binding protein [Paenibacillus sp. YYML68]